MFIIKNDQEKYHFLNVCNLCRYAWFSQAQSQIALVKGSVYFVCVCVSVYVHPLARLLIS